MPKKKQTIKTTTCAVCGQTIEYKTKKPLKCKQCTNINKSPKPPRTKWKKETQMIRAMSELLPGSEYIVNGYYSWLISPKGMPMQLDWYCPELGIAVEFNGTQHYTYTKYFHKTKREFAYQQECDTIKARLCKDRGITLIPIPYDAQLTPQLMGQQLNKENPVLYNSLVQSNRIQEGKNGK